MQYQVPQNVDIEDKLIGPISPRQFLILLGFAAIDGIAFVLFVQDIWNIMFLLLNAATGIAFAFVRPYDMNFGQYLLVYFAFIVKAKKRIWHKVPQKIIYKDEERQKSVEDIVSEKEAVSHSEIQDLTSILDSRGRSKIKAGKFDQQKQRKNNLQEDFEIKYSNVQAKTIGSSYIDDMNYNIEPVKSPSIEDTFKSMKIVPDKDHTELDQDEQEFLSSVKKELRTIEEEREKDIKEVEGGKTETETLHENILDKDKESGKMSLEGIMKSEPDKKEDSKFNDDFNDLETEISDNTDNVSPDSKTDKKEQEQTIDSNSDSDSDFDNLFDDFSDLEEEISETETKNNSEKRKKEKPADSGFVDLSSNFQKPKTDSKSENEKQDSSLLTGSGEVDLENLFKK